MAGPEPESDSFHFSESLDSPLSVNSGESEQGSDCECMDDPQPHGTGSQPLNSGASFSPETPDTDFDFDTASDSESSIDLELDDSSSESEWDMSDLSFNDEDIDVAPVQKQPAESEGAQDVFTTPLYKGAKFTIFDSFLLLLRFSLRFQLAGVAFDALIKLVSAIIPKPNKCARSLYMLRKYCLCVFPSTQSVHHYFCTSCHAPVENNCLQCHHCNGTKIGRFLVADIGAQLRERFKDPEFWKGLQSRPLPSSNRIHDIYDGLEYCKHSTPGGFLCKSQNPANLSFLFNTDGVALFKSTTTDIWPVFLAVNELPPHMRFSKKHLILAGLWYGKEKPFMLTYLSPIVKQINHLFREGVQVVTPNGLSYTCKTMLLLCSADLPARALVANMKAFNGKYGCSTCEDPGQEGKTSLHRIWPYNAQNVIRRKQSTVAAISQAIDQKNAVLGYKGFPVLSWHPAFDVVKGMVTDYLHCVMLGVTKALLNAWLDPKKRSFGFYIGNQSGLLDEMLSHIKVPDVIKRPPRCLKERKHWKGTEWQYWLLFYSLPILKGVLPSIYYIHYCSLVCAISILLSDDICEEELHRADVLLNEFYSHTARLYGVYAFTMNIHQLKHLAFHVKNWGPLWSYSCFGFESVYGNVKKLFHGTREMSEQMMFSFSVIQNLPHVSKLMSPHGEALICRITGEKKCYGLKTQDYGENIWRIGNTKEITLKHPCAHNLWMQTSESCKILEVAIR